LNPKISKISDIFFDLDHTLWDFDANSFLAFDTILKENHQTIDTLDFVEIYAPINQACWKLYQTDKITHDELRYQRLKQTFDALNYSISDNEIDAISNKYIALLPENNILFQDAKTVLKYLSGKYRLHIITNGFSTVQEKKLRNSRLENYFTTITNSEMAGAKKPNSIIFEYALSLANASKNRSIMIGDCIEADVLGAINFGMQAIWFNPNQENCPENILQINNLIELKIIL